LLIGKCGVFEPEWTNLITTRFTTITGSTIWLQQDHLLKLIGTCCAATNTDVQQQFIIYDMLYNAVPNTITAQHIIDCFLLPCFITEESIRHAPNVGKLLQNTLIPDEKKIAKFIIKDQGESMKRLQLAYNVLEQCIGQETGVWFNLTISTTTTHTNNFDMEKLRGAITIFDTYKKSTTGDEWPKFSACMKLLVDTYLKMVSGEKESRLSVLLDGVMDDLLIDVVRNNEIERQALIFFLNEFPGGWENRNHILNDNSYNQWTTVWVILTHQVSLLNNNSVLKNQLLPDRFQIALYSYLGATRSMELIPHLSDQDDKAFAWRMFRFGINPSLSQPIDIRRVMSAALSAPRSEIKDDLIKRLREIAQNDTTESAWDLWTSRLQNDLQILAQVSNVKDMVTSNRNNLVADPRVMLIILEQIVVHPRYHSNNNHHHHGEEISKCCNTLLDGVMEPLLSLVSQNKTNTLTEEVATGDFDTSQGIKPASTNENKTTQSINQPSFKPGDLVWYNEPQRTPAPASNNNKYRATIIAKHDDIDQHVTFYTISYQLNDTNTRERQTSSHNLSHRELTLEEVGRLLAAARASNDRKESIRLMKLHASLLPKPVDSNVEKAKLKTAMEERERLWYEGLKNATTTTTTTTSLSFETKLPFSITTTTTPPNDHQLDETEDDNNLHLIVWRLEAINVLCRSRLTSTTSQKSSPIQDEEKIKIRNTSEILCCDIFGNQSSGQLLTSTTAKQALYNESTSLLCTALELDVLTSRIEHNISVFVSYGLMPLFVDDWVKGNRALQVVRAGGYKYIDSFVSNLLLDAFVRITERVSLMEDHQEDFESLKVSNSLLCWSIPKLSTPLTSTSRQELFDVIGRMDGPEMKHEIIFNQAVCAFDILYRYPVWDLVVQQQQQQQQQQQTQSDIMPTTTTATTTTTTIISEKEDAERGRAVIPSLLLTHLLSSMSKFEQNIHNDDLAIQCFFFWLVLMQHINTLWENDRKDLRESLGYFLREDQLAARMFFLAARSLGLLSESRITHIPFVESQIELMNQILSPNNSIDTMTCLCGGLVLLNAAEILPVLLRQWWTDELAREDKDTVAKFIETRIAPVVLEHDISNLSHAVKSHQEWNTTNSDFKVIGSTHLRLVQVISKKDDALLQVDIKFPPIYPLVLAEVECTKQIGIRPERWKRWALRIVQILGKRDGSLVDAVALWKQSLDKEFDGIEPCPICYSVMHSGDSSLPNQKCKTCGNCFHSRCLGKWFASSHQSLCPMCKTSFLKNDGM
jgi:hypothetical protein